MPRDEMQVLFDVTGLRPARKTGRLASGEERGSGTVIHIASGDWGPALCSTKPGRQSGGWSEMPDCEVTCKRCAKWLPSHIHYAKSQ